MSRPTFFTKSDVSVKMSISRFSIDVSAGLQTIPPLPVVVIRVHFYANQLKAGRGDHDIGRLKKLGGLVGHQSGHLHTAEPRIFIS